jgi:hypothetical protein
MVEQEREQEPEDELADDRGTEDEHDRVQDDRREIGVADEALVIVEADEARARRVDPDERLVGEARVERPERWTDEEKREEKRRRRQAQ